MTPIDVAMPTHRSEPVIGETLDCLSRAERESAIEIEQLVLVDDNSADGTLAVAHDRSEEHGWTLTEIVAETSLPEARKRAIRAVTADWFLFLDDDVRLTEHYLDHMLDAVAPLVGGIQGRKVSRTENPSDWVQRRSRRAGTHATLLRRDAVEGVSFPPDLHVLEDEYLRRYVESRGNVWVFNHRARFEHANQERHPIGWQEGYLGGKYDLSRFQDVALNVPFAALTGRNPLPHARRATGWLAGRLARQHGGEPGGDSASA